MGSPKTNQSRQVFKFDTMKATSKTLAHLSIALILSTIISCKQQSDQTKEDAPPPSATVEELGQMNRDFVKALLAKDAAAAANLYSENASLLPPNEPIVTGRDNIQAYWQGAIDAGIIDASVNTLDAKSNGNLGYEVGTFKLSFLGPENDTLVDIGKFTEILERNEQGQWISIYGMWSSNEPMPTE